ncbi:MAG: hypothetical protein GX981_01290 [Tissierellia bacterium]|nr:hypothetical protein [Tissierellia bacterium]
MDEALERKINIFLQEAEKICKINFAYIFGSYALGEQNENSDIDIANHIISDMGYRKPSSNREIFEILFENKIINNNLKGIEDFKKIAIKYA